MASRMPWAGGAAIASLPSQAEYKNRLILSPGCVCTRYLRDYPIITQVRKGFRFHPNRVFVPASTLMSVR